MPLTDKTGIVTNKVRKNSVNNIISTPNSVPSWKSVHAFSPSADGRHNVVHGIRRCDEIQVVAAVSDRRMGTRWRAHTRATVRDRRYSSRTFGCPSPSREARRCETTPGGILKRTSNGDYYVASNGENSTLEGRDGPQKVPAFAIMYMKNHMVSRK